MQRLFRKRLLKGQFMAHLENKQLLKRIFLLAVLAFGVFLVISVNGQRGDVDPDPDVVVSAQELLDLLYANDPEGPLHPNEDGSIPLTPECLRRLKPFNLGRLHKTLLIDDGELAFRGGPQSVTGCRFWQDCDDDGENCDTMCSGSCSDQTSCAIVIRKKSGGGTRKTCECVLDQL